MVGKDSLNEELRDRQKQASRFITLSAKLIAPSLDSKDWVQGYEWVIDTLRQDHDLIASELMITKALTFLRNKNFDKAIEVPCSRGVGLSGCWLFVALAVSG